MKTSTSLLALAATFAVVSPTFARQAIPAGRNLLSDPSFEGRQPNWGFFSLRHRATAAFDKTEKRSGKSSLRIDNMANDDSFLKQVVTVKPRTRYRFTGYIKTRNPVPKGAGATLSLDGNFAPKASVVGRQDWKKVSFEFDTGPLTSIKVGPRLGHPSRLATGTAWFDDLQLIEVGPSRAR